MRWLMSENWLWLLLAALLGALVTLFLVLRKVETSASTAGSASRGASGASATGAGAVGAGAMGAGAAGVGAATIAGRGADADGGVSAYDRADASVDADEVEGSAYDEAGAAGDADQPDASYESGDAVAREPASGGLGAGAAAAGAGAAGVAAPTVAGRDPGEAEYRGTHAADSSAAYESDSGTAGTGYSDAGPAATETDYSATGDGADAGAAGVGGAAAGGDAAGGVAYAASSDSAGQSGPDSSASGAAGASGPYGAGSADPLEDGSAPGEGFTIKGNSDSMKFHTPESPYYGRTPGGGLVRLRGLGAQRRVPEVGRQLTRSRRRTARVLPATVPYDVPSPASGRHVAAESAPGGVRRHTLG